MIILCPPSATADERKVALAQKEGQQESQVTPRTGTGFGPDPS